MGIARWPNRDHHRSRRAGSPQGDLSTNAHTGVPELGWTSPPGRDIASVQSFAISSDYQVVAFLTNPSQDNGNKPSSLWLMQIDGTAIERFDLPLELNETEVSFTTRGVAVTGVAGQGDASDGTAMAYMLRPNGSVSEMYVEQPEATPIASPVGSPNASPASPIGSTKASPVGSRNASPQASPVGSPAASPSPAAVTSEE